MKHYNQLRFCQYFDVKSSRRNANPPIENFLATVLLTPTAIPTFPHPSLYVDDDVNWGYNKTSLAVRDWTLGQHPTTLGCCTTLRKRAPT